MSENENIKEYKKRIENKEIINESTDTNDLISLSEFNKYELKRNYLNNLITWRFLKELSEFNQWPLGCIGNLIENSLKEEIKAKNIYIDLMNKNDIDILTIFDDGIGIDSIKFNEILYSFSLNKNKEYNYFKFGLSMKTSALRLADSFLLISKTENEISLGIISKNLQKKVDNDLILTPIINYKIENDNFIPKSNFPNESENLILEEINFIFKTKEELKKYLISIQKGTRIFLYNLKQIDILNKNKYELIFDKENIDIKLNTPFSEEFLSSNITYIDISLVQYLNFFRLIHTKKTKIFLFNNEIILNNPYYNIKQLSIHSNIPTKIYSLNYSSENQIKKDAFDINTENYKGIIFNENYINNITESTNINFDDIKNKNYLNGILIYKNNYLVSRFNQNKLGDLSFFINRIINHNNIFNVFGFIQLPDKNYDLMFNGKEIKDLALYSYLKTKIKNLIFNINISE